MNESRFSIEAAFKAIDSFEAVTTVMKGRSVGPTTSMLGAMRAPRCRGALTALHLIGIEAARPRKPRQ